MIKSLTTYLAPDQIRAADPLAPPLQARIDAWATRAAVAAPVLAGLIAAVVFGVRIAGVA